MMGRFRRVPPALRHFVGRRDGTDGRGKMQADVAQALAADPVRTDWRAQEQFA